MKFLNTLGVMLLFGAVGMFLGRPLGAEPGAHPEPNVVAALLMAAIGIGVAFLSVHLEKRQKDKQE